MTDLLKNGVVEEQAGLAFYCDREAVFYKQFVSKGALDIEKLTAAGFNEKQIPQIRLICEEQGWLDRPAAAIPFSGASSSVLISDLSDDE